MTKKDILELKRRLSKTECTITKMCGCYVDANRNKVVKISETFLNLDDEEFYKYLEIARKCLSGTIGNNLLKLEFPLIEEEAGGKQQFLLGLRASELKNEDLLDRFYDLIIEHYEFAGNYLILLFHDTYDVITKTSDNMKIDESEEVYDYLLCAICPVCLSKPGLGYREEENRIGARIRDWVVGAPDVGFLFPAFSERSSDIHALTYYVKDAKDSHPDFVQDALGCGSKRTATEQKQTFHSIVKKALGPESEDSDDMLLQIQESLQEKISSDEEIPFEEEPVLTPEVIEEVLSENGITGEKARIIQAEVSKEFENGLPEVKNLIDEKALEKNAREKEEETLRLQVQELQRELVQKTFLAKDEEGNEPNKIYDVILRVKPEKASQIKSEIIAGKKYLVIPMEENEHINLNGINTQV
ncbi:MAG: DUF4317 domain-containing protein [Lachnospiraceae bacterium]|nr:DUF4317 domain-containing protein [Lachnospiraceae bacterium]